MSKKQMFFLDDRTKMATIFVRKKVHEVKGFPAKIQKRKVCVFLDVIMETL
jgi:hypothetical protein